MNKVCCEVVWMGAWRSHHCGKPAKFEVNGLNYCGIHNPNKAPTKAQIAAEENYTARRKRDMLHAAAPELLKALQEAVDGMGGSYAEWAPKAEAAIAKATGEQE